MEEKKYRKFQYDGRPEMATGSWQSARKYRRDRKRRNEQAHQSRKRNR